MPEYEITPAVENDLLEIALYTLNEWGLDQMILYQNAFEKHFKGIGQLRVRLISVLKDWPELQMSRCEHHYVFSLRRLDDCPLIFAVFHEVRDLMIRVQERIEDDGIAP
ncbi:MAG: type II toxin-antitoxin system RelE/ParE family toxin [Planctomycetota bacterium]